MKVLELPIVISFEDDIYIAQCPLIDGAFAEGETPQEASRELTEVIEMILEYKKERGEGINRLIGALTTESDKVVTTLTIGV
jgi:predicted RNase H-like HicB family nuclease